MLVATLCGLLNGALSVALGIPTIIVTLGTLSLYRGLGLVVRSDAGLGLQPETWFFEWIGGRDPIFGIWISVWAMLVVGIVGWVLFNQTAFGRACRPSAATARPRCSPGSGSRGRGSW